MDIIDLETPLNTEKYFAPKTEDKHPFYIPEYGKTFRNTPCYQLRINSPMGCVQYVISGEGVIMCNNKIYRAKAGDTFLLPEGSDQIYYSGMDNQFERIWFNYNGELARLLIELYGLQDNVVFENVNTSDIMAEMFRCCHEEKNPQNYKNKTSQIFLKLIQYLSENKENKRVPVEDVEKIRAYIDCHITEKFTLPDIAAEIPYTKEHIIRTFKKNYGITPYKYIIQSKMRLAMIMLKMSDAKVAEIAENLSFTDANNFSSQFKKTVGITPSEYRSTLSR